MKDQNEYWAFGLSAANISQSSLRWADGRAEMFPASTVLGAKYSVFGAENCLSFFADLRSENSDFFNSLGLEWRPVSLLALRGGASQTCVWQDDREIKTFQLAAGLGLDLFGFSFDYAFNPDAGLADSVSHFFTLGYAFGAGKQPAAGTAAGQSGEEQSNAGTAGAGFHATDQAPRGRRRLYKDILHLTPEEQLVIEDLGFLDIYKPQDAEPDGTPETTAK